jgi:hypothetical protein
VVDVFEEVEEEMRAEKWRRLAIKYLPWIGGLLLLALLIALGVWGYDAWRKAETNKASEAYARGVEALQKGDRPAATKAFTESAEANTSAYKALALMNLGGLLIEDEKTAEAVKRFDEAAKATSAPLIADAARLKAALAVLDTAPYAELEERLRPLTEDGRPYRPLAREALGIAMLKDGKTKEARGEFVVLTLRTDTPETLKARAQAAIAAIDSGATGQIVAVSKAAAALPQAPAGLEQLLPNGALPPGAVPQ